MTRAILVLNSGSSSIKFGLYPAENATQPPLVSGKIAGIGVQPDFTVRDAANNVLAEDALETIAPTAEHGELTARLLDWIDQHLGSAQLVAAGHRVVHGGQTFSGPVRIDLASMTRLRELIPLAPLHQPHNLAAIETISRRHPELAQVACFDTAFHRTQPRIAQLFGLPREISDAGVVRYGFHGLSYDYIASVLPEHLPPDKANGKVIVAHLGNGASMCALHDRKSVATTMGFTALHGLLMGRRCGTIDAGVVLHLMQQHSMSIEAVQKMLYRESGLLGVSGISNNMQHLSQSDSPEAKEAVDLFCYRAVSEIGSLTAALRGLDTLIFTAGIGEHASNVRAGICGQLDWLGVSLNGTANDQGRTRISAADSQVDVLVIPTNEEQVIANATRALI